MTKMKRLSITLVTSMMKIMKNSGASGEPQFNPGVHSGSVSKQSYMTLFQSSPVATENKSMKL